MPIKLSIDNNFLKVEGNDPERIYYERSRISHDIPTATTVQLRYDNNKLALLDTTTQDSTGTAFSSIAAIITFLTTAGDGDTNAGGSSSGGGGSTLTQADVQTAMTNALLSQNQVEYQQSFLEDDNGTFIRIVNINEETGVTTTTNTTLAGAPYTPVGTIRLASQARLDTLIDRASFSSSDKTYYRVTTGDGTNTAAGDYIYSVNRYDSAGNLDGVKWFNLTTGNLPIVTPPTPGNIVLWNRLMDDAVTQTEVHSQTTNDLLNTVTQTEKLYYAITAGVGYSVGDEIAWLYRLDGSITWVNKTTRSPIAAPVLTNLVTDIKECYHEVVTATVPNTLDTGFQVAGSFVNSPFVNIPTIAGKKCNLVSVVVGAATVVSPLFPSDVGLLIQSRLGGGGVVTALSSPNRPNQINIPGGSFTSWGWLMPESTRITIQNTNLSSYPITYRFWYSEDAIDTHNFGTNAPPARQITSEANITTGTSPDINARVDMHSAQVLVDTVGATTNVRFILESFNAWHGLPAAYRPVAEFVLPLGVTHGVFTTAVTSRFGALRLRAVGTLTSFSYTLEINNDQY